MATDARAAMPSSRSCRNGQILICEGYDNEIRWQSGQRLEQLFEQRCDEHADKLAVDGPAGKLTYAELDARANRLARHLRAELGICPGDRVGLLLDTAVYAYVAMVAALKLHAPYVPLDPGFPADRLKYIVEDAGLELLLSSGGAAEQTGVSEACEIAVLDLDRGQDEIERQDSTRLRLAPASDDDGAGDADELCYVIYTSGTTGRPKGVAIGHAAICNFVLVAAEVYGFSDEDRVYQGLTPAFDFAIEEMWIPWMVGATLVPKPTGGNLLGPELHDFILEQQITALCCVPTLLATLEDDLPDLRVLLVSGEQCPEDLVKRWHRPERRFLNVYGPTEATVSATWAVVEPDREVTIGVPLPTYSVVILDPDEEQARPLDQEGEIGLAGVGLAREYLGQPDKTGAAFIKDFLDIPNNPSHRIYRTGDLGRVNDRGEIEYSGRIDTQVKIRGYRIEPAEIEAVLREAPGVDQAAVGTYEPDGGATELVGYCTCADCGDGGDGGAIDADAVYAELNRKLPAYMVPAYLEPVGELPMMPNGKVDRKRLPEPKAQRHQAAAGEQVEPDSELEQLLAGQLARTLDLDEVSVESHFFEELGASSLLIAQFSAEVRREQPELPPISMRDVYSNPTIRGLAQVLGDGEGGIAPATPEWEEPSQPEPVGTPRYYLCGLLQLLAMLIYLGAGAAFFDLSSDKIAGAHGVLVIYGWAVLFGAVTLIGLGSLPVVAKWLLIGRFKPRRIRIWSPTYVRFWIVKTLIIANPVTRLLRGTGLYSLYLRALGADIGAGAMILTNHVPICTDLLSIGPGAIIRTDAILNCYRARDGLIEIGPVTIGRDAFVGHGSLLDIHTEIGEKGQLGHSSALLAGQAVPAGECWNGSPGRPADEGADYLTVPPKPVSRLRRFRYGMSFVLVALAVFAPAEVAVAALLFGHTKPIVDLSSVDALEWGPLLVVAAVLAALLVAIATPRLLGNLVEEDEVYPLHGFRFTVFRIAARASQIPLLTWLFGDSNAIVHYLRLIGYRLAGVEQTGSNFGLELKHDVPWLSGVGSGTMASDGLSLLNAEYSSSSFRLRSAEVGPGCFLGNGVVYPGGARVGENCLIGTKTMVPVTGEHREGVGLLGSPPFEIPREVQERDEVQLPTGRELQRALRAKRRHNVATMAIGLIVRMALVAALLLIGFGPFGDRGVLGWAETIATEVMEIMLIPLLLFAAVECALTLAVPLKPRLCSIYAPELWRHERYWKVPSIVHARIFDGTPCKNLVWRLHGVKIGGRVYDDGCTIVERQLTTVGRGATLNMGSVIQGHSLEDGVFKSDRITIGAGCTVGALALVHYSVNMAAGSTLEADAFLMKGSEVSEGSRWRGNPASEVVETQKNPTAGARAGACTAEEEH